MQKNVTDLFLSIAGGALLGLSWNFPNQILGAIIAWPATYLLLWCLHSKRPYLHCYLYGVAFHPFGFYWLNHTIGHFGGFSSLPTLLIFTFFVLASSLQLVLFPLFFSLLPRALRTFALAAPIAWMLSEFYAVKIFPWHLGHTQLAFPYLIQIADLSGSILISGLMIWLAGSIFHFRKRPQTAFITSLALVLTLGYGFYRVSTIDARLSQNVKPLEVALVQANISIEQKHNPTLSKTNTQHHLTLSEPYAQKDTLIIWPETSIVEWLYDNVGSVSADARLPFFGNGENWLLGGLTYENRSTLYNSSIAIFSNGEVPEPYHKKILMPFGEYTPLGDLLPWLKALNTTAGEFTAGQALHPFTYPYGVSETAQVAPLNCYEDIVTGMGIEAVQNGAEVLVNQTNDGWFGETIAPYQHHVLAAFRSVETRRYLLRATNSGLTAVVDPLGRTTEQLPPFSPGVISTQIELLNIMTPYAAYIGQKPYWLFTILICYTILMKLRNFFLKRASE